MLAVPQIRPSSRMGIDVTCQGTRSPRRSVIDRPLRDAGRQRSMCRCAQSHKTEHGDHNLECSTAACTSVPDHRRDGESVVETYRLDASGVHSLPSVALPLAHSTCDRHFGVEGDRLTTQPLIPSRTRTRRLAPYPGSQIPRPSCLKRRRTDSICPPSPEYAFLGACRAGPSPQRPPGPDSGWRAVARHSPRACWGLVPYRTPFQ